MAWYTAASSGSTCVAAYDAVGAASLADSYVNEANPGTNDAAPGTAPTWAYGTGWTFNGTTQYLTTGITPGSGYSAVVRFSGWGGVNNTYLLGELDAAFTAMLGIRLSSAGTRYFNAGSLDGAASPTSGVLAVAGNKGYKDAVAESGTIGGAWSGSPVAIAIGAVNNNGSIGSRFTGNIQALSIYSGTLNVTDVTAITAAMNALPAASGAVSIILQAHGSYLGAGMH